MVGVNQIAMEVEKRIREVRPTLSIYLVKADPLTGKSAFFSTLGEDQAIGSETLFHVTKDKKNVGTVVFYNSEVWLVNTNFAEDWVSHSVNALINLPNECEVLILIGHYDLEEADLVIVNDITSLYNKVKEYSSSPKRRNSHWLIEALSADKDIETDSEELFREKIRASSEWSWIITNGEMKSPNQVLTSTGDLKELENAIIDRLTS